MAAGLHWFLKYACRSSVSWNITGGNNIDGSCFTSAFLEGLEQQGGMRRERSVPWHYYQNVVTPRSHTPRKPWPALHSSLPPTIVRVAGQRHDCAGACIWTFHAHVLCQ